MPATGSVADSLADIFKVADASAAALGYPPPALRDAYHVHVLNLVAQGYVQLFATRDHAPDWVPHTGYLFPWGVPNHDTIYRFAPIDARGSYRVSGILGDESVASLMFRKGGTNTGEVHGATLGEIDLTALGGEGSRFSIRLGGVADTGAEPRFDIPEDATSVIARQVTSRADQRDGVWTIERLDTPAPGDIAAPTPMDRMRMLHRHVERQNTFLIGCVRKLLDEGLVNAFAGEAWRGFGGIAKQVYFQSAFEFDEDEVLILESDMPHTVNYWSVQLVDPFFAGIDIVSRFSARNGDQLHVDPDGKVRIVVSVDDPGVANWLETGGWTRGAMMWRWNEASEVGLPTVRRVKRADLTAALPSSTHRLSVEKRSEERLVRVRHYQSRRRL
ncbi:DUF1214 domain-containing protein [Sphingobium sp. JS3065]|uniref:DUF1214 domain-containing protein n=1 Tax=Sphingobium sp. JS3065 TaxID=2970925 RepID=UPI002263D9CB|nr:DUF1214 domain-containing protein [Sphingobium sp. JS3065]UZW57532.1 DUF1214 domain-containing protein [Sphingobium sp. JS3065]